MEEYITEHLTVEPMDFDDYGPQHLDTAADIDERPDKRYQIKSVTILGGEGLIVDLEICNYPRTFDSLTAANLHLSRRDVPDDMLGALKTDFTIEWEDGNTWTGTYMLEPYSRAGMPNIGRHVREFAEYCAGMRKPANCTQEQYISLIKFDRQHMTEFLGKYRLA